MPMRTENPSIFDAYKTAISVKNTVLEQNPRHFGYDRLETTMIYLNLLPEDVVCRIG